MTPLASFLLAMIVAAAAVLHVSQWDVLLHVLQAHLGTVAAVSLCAGAAIAIAVGGVFFTTQLWHHPDRKKGKGAAGLFFIVATLAMIFETVRCFAVVVQVPDIVRLLQTVAQHENARITSEGDGVLSITGPIGPTLTDDFVEAARRHAPIRLIKLSSPGGLIEPAMDMAQIIEKSRVRVLIHGDCSSACLLLAVASPSSYSVPEAVFGFHRVSAVANAESEMVKYSLEEAWVSYRNYLQAHGVPSAILDEASKHGPSSVYPVTAQEMVSYGVIKGLVANR